MGTWSTHHNHKGRTNQQGIALLEVMIALALVTITMAALLSLRTSDLRTQARTQHLQKALVLLHRQIDLLPLQTSLKAGETNGTFPTPHDNYQWTQTLKPTPFPSLWEVTLRVLWSTGSRPQSVDATTYLHRQTPGGGS